MHIDYNRIVKCNVLNAWCMVIILVNIFIIAINKEKFTGKWSSA